jgi:hypothetical protein
MVLRPQHNRFVMFFLEFGIGRHENLSGILSVFQNPVGFGTNSCAIQNEE